LFGAHLVMERETVGEQSARRERWGIGQLGQAQAKESGTGSVSPHEGALTPLNYHNV